MWSENGGVKDVAEIKRASGRAAELWKEAMTFFELQLSTANGAASKTEVAAKAASDVVDALPIEIERTTKSTKEAVGKTNETLHSAVGHASLMTEAAKEMKKKAQEALSFFREAAGFPTAPNDMQEQEEKEKKTQVENSAEDPSEKATADTNERTEKGTTTEEMTADDTAVSVESTNRELQEDFFCYL